MCAFQSNTGDGGPHVVEIAQREVVGHLLDVPELAHLAQTVVDHTGVYAEAEAVYFFLAKCGETSLAQQLSYLCESYLVLKIVWIYHVSLFAVSLSLFAVSLLLFAVSSLWVITKGGLLYRQSCKSLLFSAYQFPL